jgi:hypothetical protein
LRAPGRHRLNAAVVFVEHDLRALLEVAFEHPLEIGGKAGVFDGDVELPVAHPALQVQVGRADACP